MFVLAEFTPVCKDLLVVSLGALHQTGSTSMHQRKQSTYVLSIFKESLTLSKKKDKAAEMQARDKRRWEMEGGTRGIDAQYRVSNTVIPIKLGQHITQRLVKNVAKWGSNPF